MKTWKDITLEQFEKIEKMTETIDILSVLENKSPYELEELTLEQLQDLIEKWKFMSSEKPDIVPVDIFLHQNKVYTMIDLSKITVGEFETIQHYQKENDIRGILSVLYREAELSILDRVMIRVRQKNGPKEIKKFKTKPWSKENQQEIYDIVSKLPYNFVYSASVFFLISGLEYSKHSNPSFMEQVISLMDSMKNGGQLLS